MQQACKNFSFNLALQIGYKAAYNRDLGKCPYITDTPQREHQRQMKVLTSDVGLIVLQQYIFYILKSFLKWHSCSKVILVLFQVY